MSYMRGLHSDRACHRRSNSDVVTEVRADVFFPARTGRFASASRACCARHIRIAVLAVLATIGLDISPSVDRITSLATAARCCTRCNLLWAELLELAIGKEIISLQLLGCRECPARPTMALVLHCSDSTLGTPINRCSSIR